MDPVIAQRLRKFGTTNMLGFYFDCCEELVKYPNLSLAEVMCVFATLTTTKERDEALWRLVHKEELASKKESVKSRVSMPPPPSPKSSPSPRSSPSPSKRRRNQDAVGTPRKKARMEKIELCSRHPHLKLNGDKFFLCGDSQMVRFSEHLNFRTGRDRYSMNFAGPLCRSGARITDVINRVREITTPVDMIVMVGINNITRDRDFKEKPHFKTLMRDLSCHCTRCIVLSLPLHQKLPEDHQTNIRIKELNNQLIHEDRFENVQVLDITEINNDANNFLRDGVHISSDGFENLKRYLKSLGDVGGNANNDGDGEQGSANNDGEQGNDNNDREQGSDNNFGERGSDNNDGNDNAGQSSDDNVDHGGEEA